MPALLRDAEWVNWWSAGRIQRLINNPRARVIDARTRDEYEKGHIPFSINVPATEVQSLPLIQLPHITLRAAPNYSRGVNGLGKELNYPKGSFAKKSDARLLGVCGVLWVGEEFVSSGQLALSNNTAFCNNDSFL